MTNIEKICAVSGSKPPNVSAEGIHYGVISQNSVRSEAYEEFFNNGIDLNYESALTEVKQVVRGIIDEGWADDPEECRGRLKRCIDDRCRGNGDDFIECACNPDDEWNTVGAMVAAGEWLDDNFGQYYENDEADYLLVEFENGDYWDGHTPYEEAAVKFKAQWAGYNLWVLKSPWVRISGQCSPCCPNAGDLNSAPQTNSMGAAVLTYCLPEGDEWFDEYATCPYPGEAILLVDYLANAEKSAGQKGA